MLSQLLAEMVDSVDYGNERIVCVMLKITQTKIGITQAYTPQQGRSLRKRKQFYENLQTVTEETKYRERIIVMGDMNKHVGKNRDGAEYVIGEFSISETNQEGKRIIGYCVMNSMSIMNTYPKIRRAINRHDVKTIPPVPSDHWLVVAKLGIGKPKERTKKKQKRFKLERLKDEETKQTLQQLIELILETSWEWVIDKFPVFIDL
ncbi:uncharacterized protein LOC143027429 [Oratosquilla oratoria]|uniref:uncharacterized protein LOC143027429 n=1 Tax=Oratosquilla oratoria TaxID=337810 RepID=UPI003F76E0CE